MGGGEKFPLCVALGIPGLCVARDVVRDEVALGRRAAQRGELGPDVGSIDQAGLSRRLLAGLGKDPAEDGALRFESEVGDAGAGQLRPARLEGDAGCDEGAGEPGGGAGQRAVEHAHQR